MAIRDLFSRKQVCHFLVTDEGEIAKKYNHFMEFLTNNRAALGIISELEQLYYGSGPFTMAGVEKQYGKLAAATGKLVEALNGLAPGKYAELSRVSDGIAREIAPIIASEPPRPVGELVLPLESLSPDMVKVAGSKATNLSIIHKYLDAPIPPGFVVTAGALELFLKETGLARPVEELLDGISPDNLEDLEEKSQAIQDLILQAEVPAALAGEILKAYHELADRTHPQVRLAMRSSAVGEDTEASFAGQYATELNVTQDNLLEAYKLVVASNYAPRAISYRLRCGLVDVPVRMGFASRTKLIVGVLMMGAVRVGVFMIHLLVRMVTVFLTIALLFGLAACNDVETREQKFANTEKKAAGGNVQAQYTLGLMYEQGYGVTQDKSRAVLCYRKAAEEGHVQAQYRLGYLYYHGQGCQEICNKPPSGMKKPQSSVTFRLRQTWEPLAKVSLGLGFRKKLSFIGVPVLR